MRFDVDAKLVFVRLTLRVLLTDAFSLKNVPERKKMVDNCFALISEWIKELKVLFGLIKENIESTVEALNARDARIQQLGNQLAAANTDNANLRELVKLLNSQVEVVESQLETSQILNSLLDVYVPQEPGFS